MLGQLQSQLRSSSISEADNFVRPLSKNGAVFLRALLISSPHCWGYQFGIHHDLCLGMIDDRSSSQSWRPDAVSVQKVVPWLRQLAAGFLLQDSTWTYSGRSGIWISFLLTFLFTPANCHSTSSVYFSIMTGRGTKGLILHPSYGKDYYIWGEKFVLCCSQCCIWSCEGTAWET